jgi:hypothetical protein
VSQHYLLAIVVSPGVKEEQSYFVRLTDRPASEAACDFLHVLLCVAAVNSQRMKFH